jgi:hypothetical protein
MSASGCRLVAVIVGCLAIAGGSIRARAEQVTRKIELDASEALERGMEIDGVQHAESGDGVSLYDSNLIEDDGPGIGPDASFLPANQRSPVVKVGGLVQLKKVLHVDRPGAMVVRLFTSQHVDVRINGTAVKLDADDRYPTVPDELLKQGDNEIVVTCPADRPQTVKIARRSDILRNAPERKDNPPRSFRSDDGGKTWQPLDGEAMVRLFLLQYPTSGSFASPVIDLGCDEGTALASGPVSVRSIALHSQGSLPPKTTIGFLVRSGTTPVYEAAHWSDWHPTTTPIAPHARFVQWKAVLGSTDPVVTPTLRNVSLQAVVERETPPAWLAGLTATMVNDPEIRYTSIPFEYEDPANPHLAAIRSKYHLDEVVSGSKSELEKLVKLRSWVHAQWKYHAPAEGWFPAWDADEILTHKQGFCVHYAIVYMQCAISLGYQTRYVFGGHPGTLPEGHEVCEVWSNQFNKWMLMDPEGDLHYVDPTLHDDVPLSMVEIHDRLLKTFYAGKIATYDNRPRSPAPSPWIAICRGPALQPETVPPPGNAPQKQWGPWIKWLNVRYMPRNNFFGRELPVPLEQGFHWDWPDYYVWHDATTPREWAYRHFIGRQSDVNWSINQVHFSTEASAKQNVLTIQLGTATPYLDTYLVSVDSSAYKPSEANFTWPLHPGKNRLEMRVRNTSAVLGPISVMEVEEKGK